MNRLFALVSAQGTCCVETILTMAENTTEMRKRVEAEFCHGGPDDPIAGTWREVTDNDEAQRCFVDD